MLSIEESDLVAVSGSRTVVSTSGAYAELTHAPQGESLRVFSTEQQLLFEYDPASGKTRVYIPSGDLEFVAARGDIIFTSARAISLRAHTVQVASLATVRLAVTDVFGRIRSASTVEGLIQVKAGRMRALLAGTYHFKAKKAFMKAEDDFKVNADKIHLG
jgi:hypothetical protein